MEKLKSFGELKENWNLYNAKPFIKKLNWKCENFIISSELKYQPDIFPTGRDSIQFEYEEEDGSYLEIEVFSNRISLFETDSFGCELEIENESWDNILKKINDFHAR